ncbi:MAG: PTS sugar transporter subunit IIA [Deltaproteobacteria bacterium]|nr:PTS sugar transporter subunit IIA [Deltaproteobacteria bacterium]
MIGIVIVSHGRLGLELIHTVEMIMGKLERVEAVGIEAADKVEFMKEKIRQAVEEADSGEGVLVLTDMFGGTPANLSLAFMDEGKVEVLTGFNLPMLIKLASCRTEGRTLGETASFICAYGQRNITVASELLKNKKGEGKA